MDLVFQFVLLFHLSYANIFHSSFKYLFLGGHSLFNGFRGCMRNLFVAGRLVDLVSAFTTAGVNIGVQIGTCAIRDR